MRLIDADALLKQIETERERLVKVGMLGAEHIVTHYVRNFIEDAPTVDAVEVVRCKDCVCFRTDEKNITYCASMGVRMEPEDFCSYGEKN